MITAGASIAGTRISEQVLGDGAGSGLLVELGSDTAEGRGRLLTESVFRVVEFLAGLGSAGSVRAALIDVRVPEAGGVQIEAEAEAFVYAVKGLMQSWVLERGAAVPPVNLIVSRPAQAGARDTAAEYLMSGLGEFARGAVFDVREDS